MAPKSAFNSINLSTPPASPLPSSFTIVAPSDTDIWKTRPRGAVFTAPALYLSLPFSTFRSARVTISGQLSQLYDQGGLLLAFPSPSTVVPTRWIKLGIERTQTGAVQLSSVACDRYADWSLQQLAEDTSSVTIEFERKAEEDALWAYWVTGSERKPIREVTWAFVNDEDEKGEIWVGVYAARPAKLGDELRMVFSELAIEDDSGWVVGQTNKLEVT